MLAHFFAVGPAAGSRNLLAVHLWHIIEGVGFLVTSLGGIAVAEFIQGRQRQSAGVVLHPRGFASSAAVTSPAAEPGLPERRQFLLPLVAVADASAAGVHYAVMPTHFHESVLYGGFFLVAATAQLLFAVWLPARPARAILTAGAVGNTAVVLLWLYTRTAGIPLGPASGHTEPLGVLDVLASGFEVIGAVAAFASMRGPLSRALNPARWSPGIWALAVIFATTIAISVSVWPPR